MMPTAVITGCNEGIGFCLARVALKAGYTTYATSRTNGPKLKQLQAEGAKTSILDVSSTESILTFKTLIGDAPIDILINNAAIAGTPDPKTPFPMEHLEPVFRTNTFGPLILTQTLLPNLITHPQSTIPRIALISSRAGSITDNSSSGYYAYRSSKAALNMIGKCLAVDLKEKGVLVAMLHPGMVATTGSGASVDLPMVVGAEEAAEKLWALLVKMEVGETGQFWHRDGFELPW